MCSLYFGDRWRSQNKSISSSSFDFKANRLVSYVPVLILLPLDARTHAHTQNVELTAGLSVSDFIFHNHTLRACLCVCLHHPDVCQVIIAGSFFAPADLHSVMFIQSSVECWTLTLEWQTQRRRVFALYAWGWWRGPLTAEWSKPWVTVKAEGRSFVLLLLCDLHIVREPARLHV